MSEPILHASQPDTGWRNIMSVTDTPLQPLLAHTLLLRRIGSQVMLQGYIRPVDTQLSGWFLWTMPPGYKTISYAVRGTATLVRGTSVIPVGGVDAPYQLQIYHATTSSQSLLLQASWVTDNAWPVSLPGTAA